MVYLLYKYSHEQYDEKVTPKNPFGAKRLADRTNHPLGWHNVHHPDITQAKVDTKFTPEYVQLYERRKRSQRKQTPPKLDHTISMRSYRTPSVRCAWLNDPVTLHQYPIPHESHTGLIAIDEGLNFRYMPKRV